MRQVMHERFTMCQELQVIIRENGLLRYSFGLLSLTISEAQPQIALVEVDSKDGGELFDSRWW